MMNLLKRLVREEEGQGMVEYGLIIALIAIVAMAGIEPVGTAIKNLFDEVAGKL